MDASRLSTIYLTIDARIIDSWVGEQSDSNFPLDLGRQPKRSQPPLGGVTGYLPGAKPPVPFEGARWKTRDMRPRKCENGVFTDSWLEILLRGFRPCLRLHHPLPTVRRVPG